MIHILLKDIRNFMKSRAVFGLFSVGMAVTLIIVMYVYGIYGSLNAQDVHTMEKYQTASIQLTAGAEKRAVAVSLQKLSQMRGDMDMIFASFSVGEDLVMASYTRTPLYYGGRYFSSGDFEAGTPLIIASASLYEAYRDKESIRIGEKDFAILAFSDRPYSEVPFNALEETIRLTDVQIVFKQMLTKAAIRVLHEQLASVFPQASVTLPTEPNMELAAQNLYNSFALLCIIFLALLNTSFLYRYVLKKRAKIYGVYRICGCSSLKGAVLNYIEVTTLSGCLYLFSAGINHFVLEGRLPLINSALSYRLFLLDYFVILILYMLFITLLFFPIILRFNLSKPIQLIK